MVLFLLPFCGVGLFATVKAVQALWSEDWKNAALFVVFSLVFGGVGFGGLAIARAAAKESRRLEQCKKDHPDSPWLWREDWAKGQIASSTRSVMVGAWLFALFWNLVSSPVVFVLPREIKKQHNAWLLLILVFPLAGVGLLVWAIRATLRWRKFGNSVFKMIHIPGVLGGQLAGAIHTPAQLRAPEGVRLRLACVSLVTTGAGNSRSTNETVLWEDEKTLRPDALAAAAGIPVYFQIPAEGAESNSDNPALRIVWRLEASARVPGVDYFAQFEVPVFKAAPGAQPAVPARDPLTRFLVPADPEKLSASSKVRRQTTPTGGHEFYFPPARNPGAATGLTLVLIAWWAGCWLAAHFKAPIIFPIVIAVFGLLLTVAALELWFGSVRVVLESQTVTVTRRWAGIGSVQSLSTDDIVEIKTARGMQIGRSVYYDIRMVDRAGRQCTAGNAIPRREEAEWLAAEMRRCLPKLDNPVPPATMAT